MKLIRFGELGKEKPGIIMNNKWYDLSAFFTDFNEAFFEQDGLNQLQSFIAKNPTLTEVDQSIRLGSPDRKSVV